MQVKPLLLLQLPLQLPLLTSARQLLWLQW
jgi:hypothetical protein